MDGSKGLMILCDVWFDESGTHEGSPFVVVAGFADFAERWFDFSLDWGKCLDAKPAIEYFHSVEANHRAGQFQGWSKEERDKKVIALIDVIKDRRPQPLISALRPSDYEKLLAEFPECMPPDPYIFCIYNVLLECRDLGLAIQRKMNGEKVRISLNFESNEQMESKARYAYSQALTDAPELGDILEPTISYFPKKRYKPLQAADALAYDCNKEFTKQEKNPSAPMRKSLEAILSKVPRRGLHWPWSYADLRRLVKERYERIHGISDDADE